MCDQLFVEVGGLHVVFITSQGLVYHQQGKVTVVIVLTSSISTKEETVSYVV
jgi:hypothetical protein